MLSMAAPSALARNRGNSSTPGTSASHAATARSTCLPARNYLNTQYTVEVQVGGDSFWTVPDSGSFELLVPSTTCHECRCEDPTSQCCDDRGRDSKHTYPQPTAPNPKQVSMAFGQGPVLGTLHSETVRVNDLSTPNQSVVLINEHRVQGYCESSYDGVLGLGHRKYAREGDDDTSLLTTLGVETFSICFGRSHDEPGRLDLGGGIPGLEYTDVPVIGSRHWAVQMVGVGFGEGGEGGRTCDTPPYCGAIIDSGTSLLAGPREMVASLLEGIGQPVAEDCSNVDQLPDLKLHLGPKGSEVELVLTPDVYVSRIKELWGTSPLDANANASSSAPSPSADATSASTSPSATSPHHAAHRHPRHSHRSLHHNPTSFSVSRGHRHQRHANATLSGLHSSTHSQSLLAQAGPAATGADAAASGDAAGAAATTAPPGDYCSVVFMELGMEDKDYGPVWILGVPFMRAYSAQFKRSGPEGTLLSRSATSDDDTAAAAPAQTSSNGSDAVGSSSSSSSVTRHRGDETTERSAHAKESGLLVGFAQVPRDSDPCAGCSSAPTSTNAQRPPSHSLLLAQHDEQQHSLLSDGTGGGHKRSSRPPQSGRAARQPVSVSLQHARLPHWAQQPPGAGTPMRVL